jgi:hypothetical protein
MTANFSSKKSGIDVKTDGGGVRDARADFVRDRAWTAAEVQGDRSSAPLNLCKEKLASGLRAPCLPN